MPYFNERYRTGSSPHVRGAQDIEMLGGAIYGIIPACAGSTGLLHVKHSRNGDHPRMCGEHRLHLTLILRC